MIENGGHIGVTGTCSASGGQNLAKIQYWIRTRTPNSRRAESSFHLAPLPGPDIEGR